MRLVRTLRKENVRKTITDLQESCLRKTMRNVINWQLV